MKFITKLAGAVAVASATMAMTSAHAAVYTGTWDPAYGATFSGLGWKGSASFFIPDACLALSGWVANGNACSGGTMDVLSASLSFYDLASNPLGTGPAVETFTLDASAPVYQMFVGGGQLMGVSTGFFVPVNPTTYDGQIIAGGGDYYFHLKFLKAVTPAGTPSVQLYHTYGYEDPACIAEGTCTGASGASSNKAILVLTPAIPEPSTYALMLAGLAAVGAIARRRRAG